MPSIELPEGQAEVDYGLFDRLEDALEEQGVDDPDGKWAAALVRATQDDDYKERMFGLAEKGTWPAGLIPVFERLASGEFSPEEEAAPESPDMMGGPPDAGMAAMQTMLGQQPQMPANPMQTMRGGY